MMTELNCEPLFYEFQYKLGDRIYVFDDYEGLKLFRLEKTAKWLRPLVALRDDFHRVGERYYEDLFGLPNHYLAGLYYQLPHGVNKRRFAKRAADDLARTEMRKYIKTILAISLNKATTELAKQNFNNRRLIEHHITNQIIRSEAKRAAENRTQDLRHMSLPSDLAEVAARDSSPQLNQVSLGSSDIIIHHIE